MSVEQIGKAGLLRRLLPFSLGSAYNSWAKIYVRFDDVRIITKDGIPIGVKDENVTIIGADVHLPGTDDVSLDTIISDTSHPLYHFTLLKAKRPVITGRLDKTLPAGKTYWEWARRPVSVLMYKLGVGPLPLWASKDADHQTAFQQILTNLGDLKWLTS